MYIRVLTWIYNQEKYPLPAMSQQYTKAAALRILIGIARKILDINVELCRQSGAVQVVYISVDGRTCVTFLYAKEFVVVNADFRKKGAELVEVVEVVNDDTFTVFSHKTNNYYVVRPYHWHEKSRCECGDCHFRGAKCKHQVTVAQFLTGQLLVA